MDSAARWTARLEIIAPLTLLACGLWVFVFAPTETEQGFVQKIMYIHAGCIVETDTVRKIMYDIQSICIRSGLRRYSPLPI